MTTAQLARTAYARSRPTIRTDRQTEYDAFARITRQLQQAADGDAAAFPRLAAAIHDNRRLWTILAIDVAHPDNRLPEDLKSRILTLAQFTHRHGAKVLEGQASPDILIEINTAIMAGLRGQPVTPGDTPTAVAASPGVRASDLSHAVPAATGPGGAS